MHYKNGREAKENDSVIFKDYAQKIRTGKITSLTPGQESCNCNVVEVILGGTYVFTCLTVGQMVHVEDAWAAISMNFMEPGQVAT